MTTRCRHARTWLFVPHTGTYIEWCYECGAWRRLAEIGKVTTRPITVWVCPVGRRGKDPWDGWQKRCQAYRRRYLKEKSA